MKNLRLEMRSMLKLAIPVVIAEIGSISMSIVDTLMVGRVSAEAIAAVGLGGGLYMVVALFGLGLLLGLDYLVAKAYGEGDMQKCQHTMLQGVYLAILACVPLMLVFWLIIRLLPGWGIEPAILPLAIDYLRVVSWSLWPLLLYVALRRYLQAIDLVLPVMVTLLSANLVNALANWIFVFGNWGAPVMGPVGAAYATTFSKIYMALGLVVYILWRERRAKSGLFAISIRPDFRRLWKLTALGLPVAVQIVFEAGVFTAVTVLAGKLSTASLASHQIVLRMAGLSFMVPLGISAAGAVRVGQNLGAKNPARAIRAGWLALGLGILFMCTSAAAFVLFPRAIMQAFTQDAAVISVGVSLFYVAAVFQIFDGMQVIESGILRGTGDTRTPMVVNLLGHWLLGLPIGYYLGFGRQWDVLGLWVGLCVGLIAVALALLMVWIARVRRLRQSIVQKEN